MNDADKNKRRPAVSESSVNSILIIEDEEAFPVILRFTSSKNMFLTKVSFYFMLYMIILSYVAFQLVENVEGMKVLYRNLYVNQLDWFYFIIWILIKVSFCFFGERIRKLAFIFYLFDIFISFLCYLGLYFIVENFIDLPYIYNGHYLIITTICIASSSIGLFLTTIYRAGPQIYSISKGIIVMSLLNLIVILQFRNAWQDRFISDSRYRWIWMIMLVFNFYIARNSWMVVNCRGDKFYDHEHIYAFECYFTDFFFNFWVGQKDVLNENKKESEESESKTSNDDSKPDDSSSSNKESINKSEVANDKKQAVEIKN